MGNIPVPGNKLLSDIYRGITEASSLKVNHPFIGTPSTERLSASTWTLVNRHGGLNITQSTPGANKIYEGIYWSDVLNGDSTFELVSGHVYSRAIRFRCFVGPYIRTNATATSFAGIELGTFDSAPNFPTQPTTAVAQLRFRLSDMAIELVTGKGDGSDIKTSSVIRTDLGLAPHGGVLELILDIKTRSVYGFVNGILVHEHGEPTFPEFGVSSPINGSLNEIFAGIVITTGSNAAATINTWLHFPEFEIIRAINTP